MEVGLCSDCVYVFVYITFVTQMIDFSVIFLSFFFSCFGQKLKCKHSDFWFCNRRFHQQFLNHLLLQSDNAEQESSDSHFMRLVQNLLRDPEERKNFFQVSFGCILLYKQMCTFLF